LKSVLSNHTRHIDCQHDQLRDLQNAVDVLENEVRELRAWRERSERERVERGISVIDLTGDPDSDDELEAIPFPTDIPHTLIEIEDDDPTPGEVCIPLLITSYSLH
jgi:hypothetical protein